MVGDEGLSNMWVRDLHLSDSTNKLDELPKVGAMVSWPRLRSAVERCSRDHGKCRSDKGMNFPRRFRVIDIARRCITETTDQPFAALSYVWGKDTRSTLLTVTRATIAALSEEGGLTPTDMPRTIEDAMRVCTKTSNRLFVGRPTLHHPR